ncbi:MAG: hypothetical protein HY402_01095 [Elusimicrobia bacterium]|nr:hypothetical protein [Elusimicrobiota bacterium]
MSFKEIIGQERAVRQIQQILRSGRIGGALLFEGPEGIGKRTAAVELAKALNCMELGPGALEGCGRCSACERIPKGVYPDVRILDDVAQAQFLGGGTEKQRNLRIELVREISRELERKSLEGRWKVALLDGAEKLTPEAGNCLLKILEEPPAKTLFILTTSSPLKLLPTVLSRCQRIAFRHLAPAVPVAELHRQDQARLSGGGTVPSETRMEPESREGVEKILWGRLGEVYGDWVKDRSRREGPEEIRRILWALDCLKRNAHPGMVLEAVRQGGGG